MNSDTTASSAIRSVLLFVLLLIHFEHSAAMLHNFSHSEGGRHDGLLQSGPEVSNDQRLAEGESKSGQEKIVRFGGIF